MLWLSPEEPSFLYIGHHIFPSRFLFHLLLKALEELLTDHCGSTSKGGPGPNEEVIHSDRAHEGQLHVCVGVNSAWNHVSSRGINDGDILARLQSWTNLPAQPMKRL